ncbi:MULTISPECIES: amino acid ABC transporter permease [Rathayibacter]|jgi:glutamate transport system permease protein|uniref:Amino acid ABC transporter permease n=2 Tax=Rathayibacter festucae TaxID=110937 RepID=A0A3T0T0V6_9MICO|nr:MULTISPECIES: amino acid ABC transporter permease [Rathayibacter]AZZ52284.1 amino acid ABC transporter permease [Rathayibacter festucae DSM 15932]MCJ1672510.1 amino acid ABC transporter permease [Rathayibacter sp. VKM Ac-2929]MCJ1684914.1 amino acid ABC transporter permease [Rathayibacter sp. VKM Ac-2928]MCJ1689175.1 amino acid ABC transporter permease [Rathayibacter sp. VKM Ac-2927]MCJ1700825.1 amino acid ABC transporter permease [Rathayibacter festucae]
MDVLLNNLDVFVPAFGNTLLLFVVSLVFALLLGTVVGAMRVSPVPIARAVGTVYVNTIRNTPLTLLMFFFAFGYPKLDLPDVEYTNLAIAALSIYTATYVAEVLRSGINTVPIGQAEAARAIGLDFGLTMTQVVLPQAFRSVIPPLMSVLIALLKNTTVAAGFSVAEAGTIVRVLNERGENSLIVVLWVALVFVVLVTALSLLQRQLEKKWRVAR